MPHALERIHIAAPAPTVWETLADFGGVAEWAPTVRESHCATEASGGIGAMRILTTSTGDVVEEVIVEWDEGRSFAFEIPDGLRSVTGPIQETWSVEPTDGGCIVAASQDFRMKPPILGLVLGPILGGVLRKMLAQNLAGLKHHIEAAKTASADTTAPL